MQVIAFITPRDFEAALAAARSVGTVTPDGGLATLPGGSLTAKIERVWENIESALDQAYRFGMEKAKATLDAALDAAEQLLTEVGRKAREVHQVLMEHAATYISNIMDSMIATIRPEVTIGLSTLQLDGVDLAQSISLSGSLRIAITDIASFTANGQLTVNARYRLPRPPDGLEPNARLA